MLDKTIGRRKKYLLVENVEEKEVRSREDVLGDKIVLTCSSPDEHVFLIDEALLLNSHGEVQAKGLWTNLDADHNIKYHSALARLLRFYGLKSPSELKNKTIVALPKKNNYLAVVADDINEENLPW